MNQGGSRAEGSSLLVDSELLSEAEKHRNGSEADDATRLSESEVFIEAPVFERNGFEDDVDVLLMQWTTFAAGVRG